ncbi:uncharacterized protein B0I36DRAFT_310070 [Microdochium trichocladiopsis]|uniref:UBC core domain-containing protein n=1 Tax=Microdochium trichocladiopsis TaxID=1682393 RepID=A0A9P8YGV7_9PEZI|nr:uncharacterized protein B0I36DRAFT_310070 [Microdochium trichocladiopsis]KAH7040159.1 hypothetical protein B0I36DRAFT_310070 [Microdochium trichocladiopsis]
MPPAAKRDRFLEDARGRIARGQLPGVQSIEWTGDGFSFMFAHICLRPQDHVEIRVLCEDGTYLAYTDSEVPATIASTLEHTSERVSGMTLEAMLAELTDQLRLTAEGRGINDDIALTDVDDWTPDDDAASEAASDEPDFEYGDDIDDDAFFGTPVYSSRQTTTELSTVISSASPERIRRDLEMLKLGGFRVGIVRGFTQSVDDSIVSAAVRVDKLHLPDDTLEAWGLGHEDFIVVLIRYIGSNYTTFEEALELPDNARRLQFRLRKCSTHKPSPQQALSAFAKLNHDKDLDTEGDEPNDYSKTAHLSQLCVGESIDMFMDKDFLGIFKRWARHYSSKTDGWALAMVGVSSTVDGLPRTASAALLHAQENEDDLGARANLPMFLQNEHLDSDEEKSLALVAVQFAMRHFVNCTKYCLICQRRLDTDFESLKPYVCGKPLCLYQYMTLGFAPNVEHEILNQPYVVDLLVSFCHLSLLEDGMGKIGMRQYPVGLGLRVPRIRKRRGPTTSGVNTSYSAPQQPAALTVTESGLEDSIRNTLAGDIINPQEAVLHWSSSTLVVPDWTDATKYKRGQIIGVVVEVPLSSQVLLYHARVEWINMNIISVQMMTRHTLPAEAPSAEALASVESDSAGLQALIVLCDDNIDELEPIDQRHSMLLLLATLPSVAEMRQFLLSSPDGQLSAWSRMVPSALSLLRWIIASNRSCIMQIGNLDLRLTGQGPKQETSDDPRQVLGLDGWLQFRFAQGSPEHELRFQHALRDVKKPQRSLVAWHGSPLKNWHSIIREGLDFQEVAHGRAYGNGVYFARDLQTSLGYSSMRSSTASHEERGWFKSLLNIKQAVSLVELVNNPERFQSTQPYFVVQNCDWIQCRYLFILPAKPEGAPEMVQPSGGVLPSHGKARETPSTQAKDEFTQDAAYKISGMSHKALYIPRLAITSASSSTQRADLLMRRKAEQGHVDDISDALDSEDYKFFHSETKREREARPNSPVPVLKRRRTSDTVMKEAESNEGFQPGSLDFSTLALLSPPSYATPTGTNMLGRELRKLQKVQESTPPAILGWYIDFDRISNLYQWIVELHSFDEALPLARDMREAELQSIVLEIRFGRDFPLSPPFVRIVRPRFLPFMEGGGGHVTAGGAMCMELLTNTGWSPVSSIESVLLQVRMAISSVEPKPARLRSRKRGDNASDYGVGEAFDAYRRAAAVHGWNVPKDFIEALTDN